MSVNTIQIVKEIIDYLKVKNRLSLLPEIIKSLQQEARRLAPENNAVVTTAFSLKTQEKRLIQSHLAKVFHQDINIQFKTDREIVSGMVLRVADKVYDLSLNKDLLTLLDKVSQQNHSQDPADAK